MSKQWSSFTENQKQADAWREFLSEKMDRDMRSLRFQDRPKECPPCPECPDEQGEKEEELPEQPIDQSQFMEPVKGFQDLNQDLFQGRLDDAAIMREYQQFLRAQNIKVVDQGKELDLSEIRNPFRRRQAVERGAMEHERKPKIGKLEDLEKYPNLYKLVATGLKSDEYQKTVLTIFQNAGFGDVREFASAYIQTQPEEQPAQQQQQAAEQPAEEPAEQPGAQPGEEVPGEEEGGAEAPPPGTAVKKGDTYVYTSGGGKKSVVRVLDPQAGQRDRTLVQQLNPETCKPVRQVGVQTKALTTPYDKCPAPGAAEQGAQAPPPEKEKGHDWAKLPGQMEEASDQDQNTLQEAQLKRWKKLAGIIKG